MKLRENNCGEGEYGRDWGEKSEWDGVGLMIYFVQTVKIKFKKFRNTE